MRMSEDFSGLSNEELVLRGDLLGAQADALVGRANEVRVFWRVLSVCTVLLGSLPLVLILSGRDVGVLVYMVVCGVFGFQLGMFFLLSRLRRKAARLYKRSIACYEASTRLTLLEIRERVGFDASDLTDDQLMSVLSWEKELGDNSRE